jgi:ubiquinone/menaquinone biosynthesis C-methylase UbiE
MSDILTHYDTDRQTLTTVAYANSQNLEARAGLFQYQQLPIDVWNWVLSHMPLEQDTRVVEVGCGSGRFLRHLLRGHPETAAIGLDLAPGMIHDMRRTWKSIGADGRPIACPPLGVADIQALPLPDASCDIGLALYVLHHVPDIPQAVAELRRVVRPGGVVLVTTSGPENLWELSQLEAAAVQTLSGRTTELFDRRHIRFRTDNGKAILTCAFTQVDQRVAVGMLSIPELAPLMAYEQSTRSVHEPLLPEGITWDAFLYTFEQHATAQISVQGAVRVKTQTGLFVCR